MKQEIIKFYLVWVNHFLTVGKMAESYGITDEECVYLIEMGKTYHEENALK